jgi:serine/threonine protein phosphatase PrpC
VGRPENEDRFAAVRGEGGALLVVADGMGGTAGGATAAATAVDAVVAALPTTDGALDRAVRAADHAVRLAGSAATPAIPAWERPGCTLTAALLAGGRLHLAHVGDSSCWLLRGGWVRRLTVPHTQAAALAAAGAMSPGEAASGGLDHLLTRYLGMPGGAEPQRLSVPLGPADRLLVATDGVTRSLGTVKLATVLADARSSRELVAAAVAAGARDDATAVLVTVGGREPGYAAFGT